MALFGLFKRHETAFTVAEAERQELAQCADIHAASFADAWGDGVLASLLQTRGTHILVAKALRPANHPVAAFLMYRAAGREAEILTLATAPGQRGKGAGRALMDEMIRRCLAARLEEIFLEVDAANPAAIALYRKLGFRQVGQRTGYYGSGKAGSGKAATGRTGDGKAGNALIMRLDLGE
ncbi:MAG: GNAT family N-acetyltransferase [Nitratireductor sp.]|nr:GNAT family N-acetyltransferase [Nitratireductor sp.]